MCVSTHAGLGLVKWWTRASNFFMLQTLGICSKPVLWSWISRGQMFALYFNTTHRLSRNPVCICPGVYEYIDNIWASPSRVFLICLWRVWLVDLVFIVALLKLLGDQKPSNTNTLNLISLHGHLESAPAWLTSTTASSKPCLVLGQFSQTVC